MTHLLPPLPEPAHLADRCREAAAREQVQPELVEKDFYLTRLLLNWEASPSRNSSNLLA